MKTVMVFPDHSSEKGISKYSMDLTSNIKKQGMNVDEITFIAGKPLTLFKKLGKVSDYEIIHVQHEYNMLGGYGIPYFFLFFILGLIKKKYLVVTMHNVLSQKEKFKGSKIKTLFRKILYKTQNFVIKINSDKIIVHSRFFRKILIKEYGFSEKSVHVFPHSIIENIKTVSKQKARKELGLSGKVYLLIGTMTPDHGHDIILKQADKIGKTILVATNPSVINLRNLKKITDYLKLNQNIISKNKFEKYVRFDLGFISYEKWWKYFSAADLILLPYQGGIGSGIFADAMAIKKPVVTSNIPYFEDIVKDYSCIKIAKTNKDFPKIIKDAMSSRNYKKMIVGCKKYFRENGLTPISKKYKTFYESLK